MVSYKKVIFVWFYLKNERSGVVNPLFLQLIAQQYDGILNNCIFYIKIFGIVFLGDSCQQIWLRFDTTVKTQVAFIEKHRKKLLF